MVSDDRQPRQDGPGRGEVSQRPRRWEVDVTILLRRSVVALLTLAVVATAVPGAVAAPRHSARDATVRNPKDRTEIAITIFKPAAAARRRVPVIFHSHGWGGSRETRWGVRQALPRRRLRGREHRSTRSRRQRRSGARRRMPP